jgi:hypothetical protein
MHPKIVKWMSLFQRLMKYTLKCQPRWRPAVVCDVICKGGIEIRTLSDVEHWHQTKQKTVQFKFSVSYTDYLVL